MGREGKGAVREWIVSPALDRPGLQKSSGLGFYNDHFLGLGAIWFSPPSPPISPSFSFLPLKMTWAFPKGCQVHILLKGLCGSQSQEHSPPLVKKTAVAGRM